MARYALLLLACTGMGLCQEEPPWKAVERRYEVLRRELSGQHPPYRVWAKSKDELWVYDNRCELGIGMHAFPEAQLELVEQLGIRIVRVTLYWGMMQPALDAGSYDEAYLAEWDEKVARANERGIELLVVVHGNPSGAGWDTREESYSAYAVFMADMAARYPSVRYWELWNEMDSAFTDLFGAGVEPTVPMLERGRVYAQMLASAYPAIKSANPDALVLTGGMSDWTDFPRGLYEGGGRDFFDIMNLHTYGLPLVWSVVTRGAELREVMAEFGDADRPLWNTELGVDAGALVSAWGFPHDRGEEDATAFDAAQLQQWQESLAACVDTGLYAKVLPYQLQAGNEGMRDELLEASYVAASLPPGMTQDDFGFGILRADGSTPRPTFDWLAEAQLNGAIREAESFTCDVVMEHPPAAKPRDHRYSIDDGVLTLFDVEVSSRGPTVIPLVPLGGGT